MIWSVYRPEDNTMVIQPLSGQWLEADEAWLSQPPGVNPAAIVRDGAQYEPTMREQFQALFSNYMASLP